MLARSAGYAALQPSERAKVAADTASIVDAMAMNAIAQRVGTPLRAPPQDRFAVPFDVGTGTTPPPGLTMPTMPGMTPPGAAPSPSASQFTGGAQPGAKSFGPEKQGDFGTAIATGTSQAGELLRQVNFPAFVAELVQGVFQAVVDASLQQMRAYAEMVQSVAMSLNDFRDQNVTENQGRDHLISKFPNLLQLNHGEGGPTVGLRPDVDPDELPDMGTALGLPGMTSIDDEVIESQLVPAARNDLARSRQSLLATLLLMGINRIIVTDGKINAKLKFDFKARDSYQQHAQTYDYQNMGTSKSKVSVQEGTFDTGESYNSSRQGWNSSTSGESKRWTSGIDQYQETPSIVLTNVSDTTTGGELEAAAKLSGEVSLNFRSETFDINKIATAGEVFTLERVRSAGRAAPGAPVGSPQAGTAPAAPATTPAPAAAPAAPGAPAAP
ncbi:MAG TPA: hypothetical protein VG755_10725 [Nannocystaceae bacterium]|nr:hypothetical protein [Nannocystaceae bacterium]